MVAHYDLWSLFRVIIVQTLLFVSMFYYIYIYKVVILHVNLRRPIRISETDMRFVWKLNDISNQILKLRLKYLNRKYSYVYMVIGNNSLSSMRK